jgi:acyl-CoA synthetase (AMP-forming)/AMP-acid ligase II
MRQVALRRPAALWAPALSFLKRGKHYTVDVEILKRALRELVEREPSFFRDLMLDALRSDGRVAEALLELFTKHPEARLRLAQAVAGSVAVPLNVATKEDLKQLATKQDLERFVTREYFDAAIKRLEDKMATKEDLKRFATKEDLKQFATKQDLEELKKWAEENFATKQDLEQLKKWARRKVRHKA